MKAMTSKEREADKQLTVIEPYKHPEAIEGHVYMVTHSPTRSFEGRKYFAVHVGATGRVRLYNIDSGFSRCNLTAFGSDDQWEDITDKVYLNIDELINKVCLNTDKLEAQQ